MIVRLNLSSPAEVIDASRRLDHPRCDVMVGPALSITDAAEVVASLNGFRAILDIGCMVGRKGGTREACLAAVDAGAWMVCLHAFSGIGAIMEAGAVLLPREIPLVVSTVADFADILLLWSSAAGYQRLVRLARATGADGVVMSRQVYLGQSNPTGALSFVSVADLSQSENLNCDYLVVNYDRSI